MKKFLALGTGVIGGVIAARRLLRSGEPGRGLSPKEQNDEIIALLREQNELLRPRRAEPVTHASQSAG